MQGLLAVGAGLFAVALVPLALGGGTAWMLIPAHLVFSGLCAVGALLCGLDGHPARARAFGIGFVAVSLAVVGALTVGSEVRGGSWYWMVPWAPALLWSWVPPVIAGAAVFLGQRRRRSRTRRTVRRRRRIAREGN